MLFLYVILGLVVNCLNSLAEAKTILISFDGFRWDYMNMYADVLPTFTKFANDGVQVDKGLTNAFITKTFPNHRTIATGMWEENHGIIANGFWAADVQDEFTMSSYDIKFWNESTPVWMVAENHNITAVCIQFPGCTVEQQTPTYTLGLPYSNDYPFESMVDNLTMYLNEPTNPAELGVFYYFEPDHTGHEFGPHSEQMRKTLSKLDGYFGYLLSQLSPIDDIIVTADHGMASVPIDQIVRNITAYLNFSQIDHIYYTLTEVLIYSNSSQYHDSIIEDLKRFVAVYPAMSVYSKSDIPARWYYSKNVRIPDILVVCSVGWLITDGSPIHYEFDKLTIGQHGFDNNLTQMHPVFLARGPSFKQGYRHSGEVELVDVFNLVAKIVGLPSEGRNGSFSDVAPLLKAAEGQNSSFSGVSPLLKAAEGQNDSFSGVSPLLKATEGQNGSLSDVAPLRKATGQNGILSDVIPLVKTNYSTAANNVHANSVLTSSPLLMLAVVIIGIMLIMVGFTYCLLTTIGGRQFCSKDSILIFNDTTKNGQYTLQSDLDFDADGDSFNEDEELFGIDIHDCTQKRPFLDNIQDRT